MFKKYIEPKFETYGSWFNIKRILDKVDNTYHTVSFDIEARSKYTKTERARAVEDYTTYGFAAQFSEVVANSSGLSHPAIQRVTHIVLGLSKDTSVVFVVNEETAVKVFEWAVNTPTRLIFHNALFDMKTIYFHTGKFPKNYEDTALISKVLSNDADTKLARTGLKILMKPYYSPKWALDVDYETEDLYDKDFLEYTAIDGCATLYLWELLLEANPSLTFKPIATNPMDLLPITHPIDVNPAIGDATYFYRNVVKALIPDVIRIMLNGIPIDMERVEVLYNEVRVLLKDVQKTVNNNSLIDQFHKRTYKQKYARLQQQLEAKKRTVDFYLKKYIPNNLTHRTYVINDRLKKLGLEEHVKVKWTVQDIKKFNLLLNDNIINRIVDKTIATQFTLDGMQTMAEDKLAIYNKSIDDKLHTTGTVERLIPQFNMNSSKQKAQFFEYLNIDPIKRSKKTNEASWGRKELEIILEITLESSSGDSYELLSEVVQAFIDNSYGAIINNNFISSFRRFTINGTLYGNLKLFGAKTFRLTSQAPNLLNMPSTGSIYSKPLKNCFTVPDGYIILTADYSALEDRVIANLSNDANKKAVFLEGIDGHSLAATYYFKDRVTALIGEYTDHKKAARELQRLVDAENLVAIAIRQDGKPVTFGISYGAYPKKIAETIGCSLGEATVIWEAYHNEMYPQITEFRERVQTVAVERGFSHLGLGCVMYSNDVLRHIRTLFNGNSQFWSILSLLSVNKMHSLIDKAGYTDKIKCISSIYDSIYYIVENDPNTIAWLNTNLINTMKQDFLIDQEVHNTAVSEIGLNWSALHSIPNNATAQEILTTIRKFDD